MAITATIGGAVIGVGGSMLAANSQSSASKQAANNQAAATNAATAAQLEMYNRTRSDLAPFVEMGTTALPMLAAFLGPQGPVNSNLSQLSDLYGRSGPIASLLGLGPNGASGMNEQLQKYPGYGFAYDEGLRALDRSAASRGSLLSGGQVQAAQRYGQGMASQLYGTYLGQLEGYGTGLAGAAAQYGSYGNAIAGLVNTGENAAAQTGNAGSAAASGVSNALTAGVDAQGRAIQNAGTATASGYAGAANQIGSLLGNANIQALFQNGGGGSTGNWQGSIMDNGMVLSDRRAKTDIQKVGQAESGLTIYSFKIKGSPQTQFGVMSDEVRMVAPDAVRRAPDGYDRVDYAKVSRLPAFRKAA